MDSYLDFLPPSVPWPDRSATCAGVPRSGSHSVGARDGAAVRSVPADRLNLVGLATYGPRGTVDRALDGLSLHR